MKRLIIICFIGLAACNPVNHPKYKNPGLLIETRVDDLLKRMTLEEKVAQLQSYVGFDSLAWDKKTAISPEGKTPAYYIMGQDWCIS